MKENLIILLMEDQTDDLGSRRVIESLPFHGHLGGAMKLANHYVKMRCGYAVWQILNAETLETQLQNF